MTNAMASYIIIVASLYMLVRAVWVTRQLLKADERHTLDRLAALFAASIGQRLTYKELIA